MNESDNSTFEKYNSEAKEKWGSTEKSKNYSKDKYNILIKEMDGIFAEFAECMKTERYDSVKVQSLVEKLQSHITENYYNCTNEILSGLGKMYVCDNRFKNNIDKHEKGTARFVCEAIERFCTR